MMIRVLRDRLESFGRDQGGAIAILCLTGALILVMMGLLLFDAIDVANDKVHVQASADAAAHTQASVMARTMNMTAFANVGKRINVGYIAGYETAYQWLEWLRNAGIVLTVLVCGGSLIPALTAILGQLCPQVAMVAGGALCAWERERHDYNKLTEVVGATFGPEVRAFENYQQYMNDITPYWAWSKGVMSGFENQAPLTVGFPLPGPPRGSMPVAKLPIRPESAHKWDQMCDKANQNNISGSMDRWMMMGDFILTNTLTAVEGPLRDMIKKKLGDAFKGEAAGGDELMDPGDEGEGGSGGGDSGSGKSEEDFDCDVMEQVVENSKGAIKYQGAKKCDDDDEDCVPESGKLMIDAKEIKLDVNCLPIDDEMKEIILQTAGFLKKDCTDFLKGGQLKAGYYGAIFLSGFMALALNVEEASGIIKTIVKSIVPTFHQSCEGLYGGDSVYSGYSIEGRAWMLDTDDWPMTSSALMFAYRPSSIRNRTMRENYFFGSAVNPGVLADESHGVWGLSRGEITWQGENNGGPNLWESKWGARVRPVALPGEWNSGPTMSQAARSMEDTMLNILQTVHISDPAMVGRGGYDAMGMLLRMSSDLNQDITTGFGGFQPDRMQGVNK